MASLASGQQARGHRVGAVSVVDRGGAEPGLHGSLAAAGVEVIAVTLPPRAYRRERAHYRDIFSRLRPDVVHTHGYRSDVLAGVVAGSLGICRVTTVHGFTGGDWKNRIYERLQLRAFKRFEAVVAVSAPLAARLLGRGVPPAALATIPNGFDTRAAVLSREEARAILGLPPEATVLGWVGRLSREKGADVMLQALARLPDRNVILSIVGSGGERASLDALVHQHGLNDRVRWHGLLPGAGRLYRAFDRFVLSSRTEGTPISLFEAMAAEVPIVATAVGGVPDVLAEGTGWLVPPEDPAALAAALASALEDGGEARRRATNAAARLRDVYGLDQWLDQYDRLYRSIVSPRLGSLA